MDKIIEEVYNECKFNHIAFYSLDLNYPVEGIWCASGGSIYLNHENRDPKAIVIIDPYSERFKKKVMCIKDYKGDFLHPPKPHCIEPYFVRYCPEDALFPYYEDAVETALRVARENKVGGIEIMFRRSYSDDTVDTFLTDIAEYIIDLEREKVLLDVK